MLREMIAIVGIFSISSLDLYDLKVISNGHILSRELGRWAQIIPNRVDRAVREVAQEFVKDCIKEIDEVIYSQPEPEGYTRTKRLRKGHVMRKVSDGVYIVENLVPYAITQHDGWHDRGGNWHMGRPWMDITLSTNQKKYVTMIESAVKDLW